MIIMYRLSRVTFWIAKRLIRVPYIGIPNLLANASVVPELLQSEATPENLSAVANGLLMDHTKRDTMRTTLLSLKTSLEGETRTQAADEILAMIS